MGEEIKIITLGDIFKNIETEEKAFKFKDYIKDLQQKVEQLENIRKEAIEWVVNHKEELHHSFDEPDWDYLLYGNATDLLNILNKGDNK